MVPGIGRDRARHPISYHSTVFSAGFGTSRSLRSAGPPGMGHPASAIPAMAGQMPCRIFAYDPAPQVPPQRRRMRTATAMAGTQNDSGATTGYEAELWAMADALRGSMDAAEYKHVVLGLIFLKYISGRLRGAPRGGVGKVGGRGRRGPRRVHRRKHLLGAAGSPLATPEGPGATADHWPDR